MADDQRTVAELGEIALIERIANRVGLPGPGDILTGDDAAVFTSPGESLVYTTDALVEMVDFEMTSATGFDVGWKALAVNVSDVAAMGARPRYATSALCLPPDTLVSVVDQVADGLDACARRWGVALAGGDISGARDIVLSVALVGWINHGQEVRRSGAQIGDAIYVTGSLGGAAAGLAGCRSGLKDADDAWTRLSARQLRPEPRVEEGEHIRMAGASAMIDISDGLAVDLWHLLDASGVGCEIDTAAVPVDPDLQAVSLPEGTPDPLTLAILGGEDFELLFTIDERLEDQLVRSFEHLATSATRIGTATDGVARLGDEPLDQWRKRGWEHLRTR